MVSHGHWNHISFVTNDQSWASFYMLYYFIIVAIRLLEKETYLPLVLSSNASDRLDLGWSLDPGVQS